MDVLRVVRRSPLVLALAFAAAVAIVTISEGAYWQSVARLDALGAMATAHGRVQALQQQLAQARGAARQAASPASLAQTRRDIAEAFELLDRHYAGQPAAHALLGRWRATAVAGWDEPVGSGRTATPPDKADAPADPDALAAELLALQDSQLDASRSALYRTLGLGRVGVAVLSAAALLALFMVQRQTLALERQQRAQQGLVQAERDRLEIEVASRTTQLTELTHHLQTAREDERHRLARDLHDELGALLTAAKLDAARLRSRLGDSAPEAQERLGHLVDKLNTGIALGRRIIEDLRPSTLGHLGLVATLEILGREFAERSGVEVVCELAPVSLTPRAELVAFRLVQEAVTNISKYAGACRVRIRLAAADGQALVSVADDGAGFDAAAAARRPVFGLLGMRFRVESEGGTLSVVSEPGRGTQILARLPLAAPGPGPGPGAAPV